MVEDEFDEEEKARRKKESIDWRNKKRTANVFLFFTTILEIVITVAIILLLLIISAKITFSIGDPNSATTQKVFLVILLIIFFGSLFLGFFVYKWASRKIIKFFDLEKKLPEDVMYHFRTRAEQEAISGEKR